MATVSASSAPEGRRARRKARTRRALLESALDLFGRIGIYDTRLEDITEAADLGKGAFYNYFRSKDALVTELLQEAVAELVGECQRLVAARDDLPTRLQAVVRAHDAFFRRHPSYFLLMHQARGLLMRQQAHDRALPTVLERYLVDVGALLTSPGGPRLSAAVRRDIAAVVAGALFGYHSFGAAGVVDTHAATVEALLMGGVLGALTRGRARPKAVRLS